MSAETRRGSGTRLNSECWVADDVRNATRFQDRSEKTDAGRFGGLNSECWVAMAAETRRGSGPFREDRASAAGARSHERKREPVQATDSGTLE